MPTRSWTGMLMTLSAAGLLAACSSGSSPSATPAAMASATAIPVASGSPLETIPPLPTLAPTPSPASTPTPERQPTPTPTADCGVVPITPALLAGDFLMEPPLPSSTGAAVEVLVGTTDDDPLTGFMEYRDFTATPPQWTGRWEGVPAVVDVAQGDLTLDTGAPTGSCAVRVLIETLAMGGPGDGVGAGPIRLEFSDGTVIVLGPERCWWRAFPGPGLGAVTCHGSREPQWSRLMVWVRYSFRDTVPPPPTPTPGQATPTPTP